MKTTIYLLAFICLSGCGSEKVVFDKNVDFAKYKSFYCLECTDAYSEVAPNIDNAEYRELIRLAIIDELTERGLNYTQLAPNLLIDFKIVIEERTAIMGNPETAYTYWETYKYPVANFKHRTLIINLVDAISQTAVWQGIASSPMEEDTKMAGIKTKKVINRMFKKYKNK